MSIAVRGYAQYKANEAAAGPERLIVVAFETMVQNLLNAEEVLGRDFEAQNRYIQKVQDILSVLHASLDTSVDEQFCKRTRSLYEWYILRLTEANVTENRAMLADVRTHLAELRDAWQGAEQNVRTQKAASAPSLEAAV